MMGKTKIKCSYSFTEDFGYMWWGGIYWCIREVCVCGEGGGGGGGRFGYLSYVSQIYLMPMQNCSQFCEKVSTPMS